MTLQLANSAEDFGHSLRQSIAQAAKLKVNGVRLNTRSELNAAKASETELRQILLYVRERQLQVAGLICPTRHALYEHEYLEPRINIVRQSMSLARKLQTSELLVHCGRIPDPTAADTANQPDSPSAEDPFNFSVAAADRQPTGAEQFATLCEILNDLAGHGNHVGCTLCLVLPDYQPELIRRLLTEVTTGPLQITFDPATAVMTGASPEAVFRELYQHIGYVRARDAVANVDGAGVEVAISQGIVNWPEMLALLNEADYRGWVCLERTGGEQRAADVTRGLSWLNSLIPQAGN